MKAKHGVDTFQCVCTSGYFESSFISCVRVAFESTSPIAANHSFRTNAPNSSSTSAEKIESRSRIRNR